MKRTRHHKKRWVIKVGSQTIINGGPLLIQAWMQDVDILRKKHGIEVIWVTSGAIATARDKLKRTSIASKTRHKRSLVEKQALSAIGQPLIMNLYNTGLQTLGSFGAQILLTYDDLKSRDRKKNFQNTIDKLLELNVTPIINENDAVATEEIKFGDNDALSAKVAAATNADLLIVMTDVDGFYDSDPRKNKKAKLLKYVPRVLNSHLKAAGNSHVASVGTGGMYSKLIAAKLAQKSNIPTVLLKGDRLHALRLLARGIFSGTSIGIQFK